MEAPFRQEGSIDGGVIPSRRFYRWRRHSKQNFADRTGVLIVRVMQLPSRISALVERKIVREAYPHHLVLFEVLR